jgi:hypothetical protein
MNAAHSLILDRDKRRRQGTVIQFFGTLIASVIIFLTTQDTLAGVVLPSIHASWGSLRTGWWTYRNTGRRAARLVGLAFYVATAFWHAAVAAFFSVLLFVVIAHATGKQPGIDIFVKTMIVLASGVSMASVLGLVASVVAALTRVRVWVNPNLPRLIEGDVRQLVELRCDCAFNHAVFVLATSLALPVLVACSFLLIRVVAGPMTLAALTVGPILAIVAYAWVSSHILAKHPIEFWLPNDADALDLPRPEHSEEERRRDATLKLHVTDNKQGYANYTP